MITTALTVVSVDSEIKLYGTKVGSGLFSFHTIL